MLDRFRTQHHMREIHVPRMRRNVRTLGLVAQVAQVALLDDLGVIGLGDAIDFHRRGCIDQVEQGRESVAQAHATAAAVADVEHALELGIQRGLFPERRRFPFERVTRWRIEAAFAGAAFARRRRIVHHRFLRAWHCLSIT